MHNLTRAEAQRRAELLEVQRYAVELDLTTGDETFRSVTEIRFRCHETGADSYAELLAPTVHSIVFNGEELDPAAVLDGDRVALRGLAASNILTVVADCAYSRTGEGLHRFVDPADDEVYLYSQAFLYDAHRIFACFDQPDLKAVFELSVTAPPEWLVVSNAAVAELAGGRWRFAPTPSISTYLTALAAGPYAAVHDRHGDIDLGVYCRRSLAEHLDAAEILELTKASFDHYQRVFDYPYAFAKYDQLFVPEFNAGAMENPGAVTIRDEYVFRSKVTDAAREQRADTIAHEMAHMWFGDLVTMRWWDDLWLNESFATYASVVCQAEATKYRTAWTTFANIEKTWAYRQDQLPSTHPVAADIPDVEAVEVNFDGITYAKGASVLKQLAAYVGQGQFFDAMKVYFKRYEFSNTTFADLLAVLSEVSGRDLSDWSQMWLATSQVNTLRPSFEVDADGNYASFAVLQSAVPEHPVLRRHRLAVGLYSAGPDGLLRTQRVELDVDGESTEIREIVGRAAADLVLVNDDDLTYAKLRLDERSLTTLSERIGDISDSLARTLCWSAAWDMTRDAEWAGREYVRLVLAGIDAEDEISVVQALLRQVQAALTTYVDPAWAALGWTQLADQAWEGLQSAPPGSDIQLAWSRTFATAARTDEHADRIRALLDGSRKFEGLTVDSDARWALLNGLVAIGAAGDSEIDAELQRDPTSTGQRRAATANALRPTAAAKESAWTLSLSDDVPNSVQEATLIGFWHPAQTEICRPYIDRFFADVGEIWERRPGEIAKNVATYLFPAIVEQSTVDAADRWLAEDTHPSALRRLIVESRDGIARALRCRERDAQE